MKIKTKIKTKKAHPQSKTLDAITRGKEEKLEITERHRIKW